MTEVVITEEYYKELRLDAWSFRLGSWELLFICGPFPKFWRALPNRFFRRGLCPPYTRHPKQVDFVYFGLGPLELRIWGWR